MLDSLTPVSLCPSPPAGDVEAEHSPRRSRLVRISDIPGMSVISGRHPTRYTKKSSAGGARDGGSSVGSETERPAHPVIRPAAIADGIIDVASLSAPDGFEAPEAGPFTQEGDVVLETSLPFAAAYVGPGDEGLFVPNTCVLLRLDDEGRRRYDPLYITGFLNLPLTNELLRGRATGLRGLVMNNKLVGDIDIPDVPIDVQRRIAKLVAARQNEVRARRQVERTEERLVTAAYLNCDEVCTALAGDNPAGAVPQARADAQTRRD